MADRIIGARFLIFLMGVRQATIIFLGVLEDFIEIERSIMPRHKRDKGYNKGDEKNIGNLPDSKQN